MTEIPDGWVRVDEPQPGDRLLVNRGGEVTEWEYVGDHRGRPVAAWIGKGGVAFPLFFDADRVWVRRVPTVTIEVPVPTAEWYRDCPQHLHAGAHAEVMRKACGRALGATHE